MVGGGGGGAGGQRVIRGSYDRDYISGNGGGGGYVSVASLDNLTAGAEIPVTIGQGGAAGTPGDIVAAGNPLFGPASNTTATDGSAGGTTYFGSTGSPLVSAQGGTGGQAGSVSDSSKKGGSSGNTVAGTPSTFQGGG